MAAPCGPAFRFGLMTGPCYTRPCSFLCSTFLFTIYSTFYNLVSFIFLCWHKPLSTFLL